jgi:hypothetical protein
MNISELRQENAAKGWTKIPESCPARLVEKICEKRSRSLATGIPIAPREQRGRWGALFQAASKPDLLDEVAVVSSAILLEQAARAAAKSLAAANRAVEEERAQAAQNAAIVRADLFPWEN